MTKITTRQSTIRDHGSAVMALAGARKEDGTAFTYADILTAVGLPSNRDWQRSLSKYIVENGKRRRCEYTHKRESIPAAETLPGVLDEPQSEPEVTLQQILNMNQALWAIKSSLDELTIAFDELCDKWNAMTGQEDEI